jgi:hypothetical protein
MVRLKLLNIGSKYPNVVGNINTPIQTFEHSTPPAITPVDIDVSALRIVISYSLYGRAEMYIGGLLKNCEIINETFPEFWIYVFVGNDFDHSILESLNTFKNIKIIHTGVSGHRNASYRFIVIDYEEVGIAFSRDCDSYVNRRDKYCIRKFLETDKKFQIIRDNLSHSTEIMAGMWGIKKGILSFKILDKINEFYFKVGYVNFGIDQVFLSNKIYPHVRDYSQVFDEFFHFPGEIPEKIETEIRWNSYNSIGAVSSNLSLALE